MLAGLVKSPSTYAPTINLDRAITRRNVVLQAMLDSKVIDRATQNFLGTLTIVSVEPNEATGRLVGPNVAAIRPGVEVRTQL